MPGKLTTHVLDIASGRPAAGMKISLYRGERLVVETITNADGRTDAPLLADGHLTAGEYEIEFDVGSYFAASGHADARRFLGVVPVAFVVDDPSGSYHVPLLVSPWAYSTYRGS
ncbi:MAG: hydroxyisourate hydrolase [Tepidisphaeraceae bacterium]|jgi:hydroxyisourate hydrolase